MASIIEELITTLEEEKVLYEELIPIAEQKSVVIIKNDLEGLAKVNESEQIVLDRLTVLENKRERCVFSIKDVLNKMNEDMNLEKIIGFLDKQPVEQQRLKKVHEELKRVTGRLKELNLQNKDLIEESLEMIEFSMNFLQSARMAPGNNNYNKNASFMNDASVSRTGMFDAKQ